MPRSPLGRYVRKPGLRFSPSPDGVIIEDVAARRRIEASCRLHEICQLFSAPRFLHADGPELAPEVVALLLRHELVVPAAEAGTVRTGLLRPSRNPVGAATVWTELAARDLAGQWCVFGVPVAYDCPQVHTPAGGPAAIRSSLSVFAPASGGNTGRQLWDWNRGSGICLQDVLPLDLGDICHDRRCDTADAVLRKVRLAAQEVFAAGGRPLVLGGEHWLSLPVLQAAAQHHGTFSVIHFDAHTDRYAERNRDCLTNGNVMSHVESMDAVQRLLQIGVREFDSASSLESSQLSPGKTHVVSAREVQAGAYVDQVLKEIPRGSPVYISIDADVLDPSVAPEVAWPVIGGLSFHNVDALLRSVVQEFEVIGADLVEVTSTEGRRNLAAMALAGCASALLLAEGLQADPIGGDRGAMFRSGWVEELLLSSSRLVKPALVDGAITDVDAIAAGLRRVVEAFASSTNRPVARVFAGNGQRVDLLERLSHCGKEPTLSFEEWLAGVLDEDSFCLALNGVPSWDDGLHQVLTAGVVNPLIKELGVPVGGLDFYAFIANAGQTPFGVHADREPSLLLHLGPADKECLIWDRQDYTRLVEAEGRIFDPERDDRRFDPERIAEHAQRLVMKPGDALLIPTGDFHIFENKGFSAFIGLSLLPASLGAVVAEAVSLLLQDEAAASIGNHAEPEAAPALRESVLESLDEIPGLAARTASYAAANMLRLRSNGYLIYKPVLDSREPELRPDDELAVWENFPILTLRHQERLLVCLRGRLLDMRYDRHVDEWFTWLAGQQAPFTAAAAAAWLAARGRGKVADELLALAVRYRALKGPLPRASAPPVHTRTRSRRQITEQDPTSPIEWSVDDGPVLIRNGAADWPLTRSCASGDFAATHGGRELTAQRDMTRVQRDPEREPQQDSAWRTTLQEFLRYCERAAHDETLAAEPWYVKDWTICEQSELEAFLPARLPDSLQSWFWRLPAAARPAWEWIFVGPRGSRSWLHVDVMMSSAWNALASGTKHWRFLSPAASAEAGMLPESYLDLVGNRQRVEYECTQQPGDLLIVPSGWAHEVVNHDTTVAATGNFVNGRNAAFARHYLRMTGRTAWLKLLDALEHGEREPAHGR